MKPIRPLFHLYGWNGTDLKWQAMHGEGPLAMKWGMEHGFGGVPYASAFVDWTRGKILLPDDWDKTWNAIDREMLRVTKMTREYAGFQVIEVTYLELAEYLRAIDTKKWLYYWSDKGAPAKFGLGPEAFRKEMYDLWASEWGEIPPPV